MIESETIVLGLELDVIPMDELIRRIHAGELNTTSLPVDVRQRCVDHLTLEGFTCSEIMQVMKLSERTVRRDRAAVRQQQAVVPNLMLGDQLLGEFERITLASVQRLIRFSRDSETPPYARLWAEDAIVRNYQRYVDMARKMKYVEEGSRRIARQTEDDPAEKVREKRRMRESMEWVTEMMRGEE